MAKIFFYITALIIALSFSTMTYATEQANFVYEQNTSAAEQWLMQYSIFLCGGLFFIAISQWLVWYSLRAKVLLLSALLTMTLSLLLLINQGSTLGFSWWQLAYNLLASLSLILSLHFFKEISPQEKLPLLSGKALHYGGIAILALVLTASLYKLAAGQLFTLTFGILSLGYIAALSLYFLYFKYRQSSIFSLLASLFIIGQISAFQAGITQTQPGLNMPWFTSAIILLIFTLACCHYIAQQTKISYQQGTKALIAQESISAQLEAAIDKEKQATSELKQLQEATQEQLENQIQERTLELNFALQELAEVNRELEQNTIEDSLSKLYNRRHFDKKLLAEFRRARRQHTPLCVVLLDIDHFKSINDNYGHLIGDKCITAVGEILKSTLKRSADMAFRYGGEEFCLILPGTEVEGGNAIAEKIRQAIEKNKVIIESHEIRFTTSAGVSVYHQQPNTTPELLLDRADKALYKAKQSGRNQVQYLPLIDSNTASEEAANV